MTYPSVRYHRTENPAVALTPEHDDELTEAGYADTPAAFDAPSDYEPEAKDEATVQPSSETRAQRRAREKAEKEAAKAQD